MIYYASVPLTILIAVLQVAAAPSFRFYGVHADLPVVWLACWGAVRGRREVMYLIPVAGLTLGLLGSEPLGASVLALLPLAPLAALSEWRVIPGRFLPALVIVTCGGLLYTSFQALGGVAGGRPLGGMLNVAVIAPRVAALDALTAAVWYWPLRLVFFKPARGGEFRRL